MGKSIDALRYWAVLKCVGLGILTDKSDFEAPEPEKSRRTCGA